MTKQEIEKLKRYRELHEKLDKNQGKLSDEDFLELHKLSNHFNGIDVVMCLIDRLEKAEKVIEFYATETNWNYGHIYPKDYDGSGGVKARAWLRENE